MLNLSPRGSEQSSYIRPIANPEAMTVIATVGLPGSGKSEAAAVAEAMEIPVVTMGDVIRRETEARGLDPRADHGSVAKALREEAGPAAVADRSIPIIEDHLESAEAVFVDGIRSDAEVARFRDAFGDDFLLISIEAPFRLRRDRLSDRGRDRLADDGGESLSERDERERGFGMDEAMAQADETVENAAGLAEFRSRIRSLIESEVST